MNILVIPDQHAHSSFNSDRATWLGKYIVDTKPDVVVNLGDAADMASLASYDKGKRSFHGKSYAKDILAHQDFQDRLWSPVKAAKKRLPRRVILEGNHEHRVERALDLNPEYEGSIGFDDFEFDSYYDDVIRYDGQTPGTISISGVTFAHYLVSGVKGLPISGEHPGHTLITKRFSSCVVGHSHLRDETIRIAQDGTAIQGLVAGCYFDYASPWAGDSQRYYWRGIVTLEGVANGGFDPHWVSLNRLRDEYS